MRSKADELLVSELLLTFSGRLLRHECREIIADTLSVSEVLLDIFLYKPSSETAGSLPRPSTSSDRACSPTLACSRSHHPTMGVNRFAVPFNQLSLTECQLDWVKLAFHKQQLVGALLAS